MMTRRSSYSWLLLVGGLGVLAVLAAASWSCKGSSPEAGYEGQPVDSGAKSREMADTSAKGKAASPEGKEPSSTPAPGTVQVRASVASCDTTTSPVRCRIQIEEILAYGSATLPLSKGERTVGFASALLSEQGTRDLIAAESRVYTLHRRGDRPTFSKKPPEEDEPEWIVRSLRAP